MYVRCVVYMRKRLLVELHIFVYYYTIKQRILVAFWNLTPADMQR